MRAENYHGKFWALTVNNYSNEDYDRIVGFYPSICDHIVIGKEVGESGTPHLQIHLKLKSKKRRRYVASLIGNAHVEPVRHVDQHIIYCKKDGDFTELGSNGNADASSKKNTVSEKLDLFKAEVQRLKTEREYKSFAYFMDTHSEVCAKYLNFCKAYYEQHSVVPKAKQYPLRIWQQEVYEYLRVAPDDRTIMFVVDRVGNTGKTWFTKFLADKFPERVQLLFPGRWTDVAYAIQTDKTIFLFDVPRSRSNGLDLNYGHYEKIKDGIISSPKYQSTTKYLKSSHVVVFTNAEINMESLSADRYKIIVVDESNKGHPPDISDNAVLSMDDASFDVSQYLESNETDELDSLESIAFEDGP